MNLVRNTLTFIGGSRWALPACAPYGIKFFRFCIRFRQKVPVLEVSTPQWIAPQREILDPPLTFLTFPSNILLCGEIVWEKCFWCGFPRGRWASWQHCITIHVDAWPQPQPQPLSSASALSLELS